MTNVSYITPGYIEALRLPVRRGRAFADSDHRDSVPVAIVNEEFVRRYYKGQDVVGLHILTAGGRREIVGVVGNARGTSSGLGGDGSPLITRLSLRAGDSTARVNLGCCHVVSPSGSSPSGPIAGLPTAPQSIAAVDPCSRFPS